MNRFLSKLGFMDDISGKGGRLSRHTFGSVLLVLLGLSVVLSSVLADRLGFGGQSGFGVRQLVLLLGGVSIMVGGLAQITQGRYRQIAEWALLATGAITVAIISDLILDTGLPKFGVRQLMIFPVLFGAVLLQTAGTNLKTLIDGLSRASVLKFLGISIQLGLLVMVVSQYDLENRAFSQNVLPVIFYGFVVHFILPQRLRLKFFLLLSLGVIFGIFGLVNGAWLVALGFLLIGICHLPLSYAVRVLLLMATGILLVLFRSEMISYAWSGAIWPILGSMFMFRLIIYMYDLKHRKEPNDLIGTLSYFFMLPNVVFPLFPVVDYGNFRRTYYDSDRFRIYQKGLDWILRGVVQLILYRYVSYYLVLAPQDVVTVNDLIQYIISTFLLYLRVSGQFHLIVGILHLFGMNLPETHHLYYLANSFTDFWRRINIYWKDFMLKVFYYPAYFQLKGLGSTPALIFSTLFVFLITWFFHAYQWFWLRGSFLLTLTDSLFWAILAVLVVINSLYEARHGKKRILGRSSWSIGTFISLSLRTAGTFAAIAILWTLWSSTTLAEFFSLWSVKGGRLEILSGISPLVLVVGLAVAGRPGQGGGRDTLLARLLQPSFLSSVVKTGLSILVIYLIGTPTVYSLFSGRYQELIRDLKTSRLNDRDAALLQRGYYEDLIGVNRFNSQLWEVYMNRPGDVAALNEEEVTQSTGDFLKQELKPLVATVHFDNIPFRTNRWGMRDKDYEMSPPLGTYRIAVLGASSVMGWGVADDETFEALLENRLNQNRLNSNDLNFEVLNFGVSGYTPLQEFMVLEQKVLDFGPHAVFYMAHQYDEGVAIQHLAERVNSDVDIPYDRLDEILAASGVSPDTPIELSEKQLTPFGTDLIDWSYRQIVESCLERGIVPVWVFMPTPELNMPMENIEKLNRQAENAGFLVLDLSDVYAGYDVPSLWIAEWDHHPNADAHKIFADRLFDTLLVHTDKIPVQHLGTGTQ
jgi:hypothetical protein